VRRRDRHRRRRLTQRLPLGTLRGEFLIVEAAWAEVGRLLQTYRDAQGDHEGIALLFGRRLSQLTILTTAIAPEADTGPGHVRCNEEQMGAAIWAGRERGVALLAQVHSHPAAWIEHSVGDDTMVFMPFEGMLSIVVPWYGRVPLRPLHKLGVHQFQDGQWVAAEPRSAASRIRIVPSSMDLR
jgi:hypothetical protein